MEELQLFSVGYIWGVAKEVDQGLGVYYGINEESPVSGNTQSRRTCHRSTSNLARIRLESHRPETNVLTACKRLEFVEMLPQPWRFPLPR